MALEIKLEIEPLCLYPLAFENIIRVLTLGYFKKYREVYGMIMYKVYD